MRLIWQLSGWTGRGISGREISYSQKGTITNSSKEMTVAVLAPELKSTDHHNHLLVQYPEEPPILPP